MDDAKYFPIERIEQGWGGPDKSDLFRRNTVLSCDGISAMVSTAGWWDNFGFDERASVSYETTSVVMGNPNTKSLKINWMTLCCPHFMEVKEKVNEMHEEVISKITIGLELLGKSYFDKYR